MARGKFIVIEGVDGCGKTTQFNLLVERIKKERKKKILVADFPRYYDSVWGRMVGEFLIGRYGKFNDVDPHLVVLPYMIDEYVWTRDIGKPWIENGGIVLSNRFFTSNVHQIAKLKGKARSAFRKWLWPAGYVHLGILKPDEVLFLDVPPEISFRLNKKKQTRIYLGNKRKKDIAESNYYHQKEAYKEYLKTIKDNKYWKKVKCVTKGIVDPPDIIHERIWGMAASHFY